MKRLFTLLSAALVLQASPVWAQANSPTPIDIVRQSLQFKGPQSFEGKRKLTVYRTNSSPLVASATIRFQDRQNYNIQITDPLTISGIQFNMKNGVNSAFFPDEKLFLFDGDTSTSDMPEKIILGRVSDNLDLLQKNYQLDRLADDFVQLVPTYVIHMTPKNGFLTPARRVWLSKNTYQILREERYWGVDQGAYCVMDYELYKPAAKAPTIADIKPPQGVNAINLSGKQKNSFLSYKSVAEAESAEKIKVLSPTYLPPGFALKSVQVFSLFGARIQVLNYTDGLNDLLVTIRPQQNLFVNLMAGAFSLNLIKKISDLSYHAPNNYISRASETQIGVAFGDIHPAELKKISDSLPFAAAPVTGN